MGTLEFWSTILLPVLSIIIPVFATIYTVNNRIKNENHENHQPYLVLRKVESLKSLNKLGYYLTIIGRNYVKHNKYMKEEEIENFESDNTINVDLILKNIGYGVATNIKFYNLLTGHQIHGTQESNLEKNQKLFTTFDIASSEEKNIQARIISYVSEKEAEQGIEDHNRILCIYQDLHANVYSFIITINVKSKGHYDFFAYQPSSKSYKKWIRENKKQYNIIKKTYGEL